MTGNPETGPRTPAADGNRLASPNLACSSSSKHERSASSALRTSVVHGLVDFEVEAAAEGRFQVLADAYVVISATLHLKLKGGQSDSRPGNLTFAFAKQGDEWKFGLQAWGSLS